MTRFGLSFRAIMLAAVVGVQALLCAIPAGASFKYLKPGMEAAEFVLKTLDGRDLALADLKQSPAALLVFWATWSPRSEPALREAQALHERYGGSGLRIVAVNLNRPEIGLQERALIEKAARDFGLTMPVALDPAFAASSAIGVVANPALALIDPRGILVWDASGWSRGVQEQLRARVEGLLGVGGAQPAASAAARGHEPAHKALLSFNLGRTFLRQDNQARAQALFESAAEADPAWAAPQTMLGHLLLRKGSVTGLAQAEAHFRAAVTIDPADVSALAGLGETLLQMNRAEEAAPFLEKAHALDATFTPAVAGRAQALARQGRQAEALALFDAALELNPRDAAILAGRASCRELAGDPVAAAADYRQAVEILIGAR
jgi:tetratricopeptide (TPR) repeat protein